MLRITRPTDDETGVTLRLEGRVVGDQVRVLERECTMGRRPGLELRLDFLGVTYIDMAGIELLDVLLFGGVRIVNCSDLVSRMLVDAPAPRMPR